MYNFMMFLHLWTVLPAFVIGTIVFLLKKGTPLHKKLGRVYMYLMFFTALVSLFIEAHVGPQFLGHFGYIHILSVITIYTVPSSIRYARKGKIKDHRRGMILLYVLGLLVAGGFTLAPGRYLHGVLFG